MNTFRSQSVARDIARAVFSILIVVAAIAMVVRSGGRDRPKLNRTSPRMMVEVMRAETQDGEFKFDVDGVVVPYREINVAAEVGGRVTYKSLACRAGEAVHEGDLLFRIDKSDHELEVQRLKDMLEQALGSREELAAERQSAEELIQLAEEELAIRKRELDRFEKAPDPSVFSQAEIDAAKRNELMARNTLQGRKDQLTLLASRERRLIGAEQSARTQLARAELDLDRCEVRSRITGVIVTESVQQEGFVQKGGVLMVIRDTSRMEVRCNLQMQQMQWLWESAADKASRQQSPNPPKTRTQSGYAFPTAATTILYELNGVEYEWSGRLSRYANSGIDDRTRMVPCIVEVLDPEKVVRHDDGSISSAAPPTLLSGMFVKLRIQVHLPRPLVRLPVTAVSPSGDVWLVDDSDSLRRTRGEIIQASDSEVLVEQSLALNNARIVTSPLVNPLEGALVRIVASVTDSELSNNPNLKRTASEPTEATESPQTPQPVSQTGAES